MKLPIAKEGYNLIKIFLSLAIVFWILGYYKNFFYFISVILLLFFLFSTYFFRDPERKINEDANLILSPADGEILTIDESSGSKIVKIFMSAFNTHIQRAPIGGIVKSIQYKKGKFHPAMKERASIENEQNTITIESQVSGNSGQGSEIGGQESGVREQISKKGLKPETCNLQPESLNLKPATCNLQPVVVVVKQVAGAFARRIVCNIKEGEKLKVGQRIGMIKFGSQVDISFPSEVELKIEKGDRVKAGVTVIAKIKDV